ncbi:C40 family peptidase [Paenibacillus hamazuiensis]|uniref:C40 family peptidase n=1 Tax=Paenibacillus hamazuiensis TaxID=2936508 RepID=UPI0020101D06|nr:C40 family peptidase [Paenibacillus hamazuiensis]
MFKRNLLRTAGVTAAMTVMLTGAFAGQAFAAYDDMDAVSIVKKMVGKDYDAGSESPSQGFDASGLIFYVYDLLDYNMPRGLSAQYKMNKPLIKSLSSVKEGDVLFFGSGSTPNTSGIYIGNDKMILASKSKDEVIIQPINSTFEKSFIGARRVLSANDQKRVQLVLDARKYLGTPYVFGAKYGQTKTFDCSSFMKTIFAENGITLPRVSRNQAKEGKFVSKSNLDVGDLVFFTTKDSGGKIGHVGMYAGNGMMIHTYGEGGVKYSTIETGWWKDHYVTARRVIN